MSSTWIPASNPPPINDVGPDGDPMSREVIGVTAYGYSATVRYGIDVEYGDEEPSWLMMREETCSAEKLDVIQWIDLPEQDDAHMAQERTLESMGIAT